MTADIAIWREGSRGDCEEGRQTTSISEHTEALCSITWLASPLPISDGNSFQSGKITA